MAGSKLIIAAALIAATAGCSALRTPRTLQDGDAVSACRSAAKEHERRVGDEIAREPVTLREDIFLQGVIGSARLTCVVDFQARRITSANVDGVEHLNNPQTL
jgi:hypothetical protein